MTPPRKTPGQVAEEAWLRDASWEAIAQAVLAHVLGDPKQAVKDLMKKPRKRSELEAAIEAILPHVWGARSTRRERAIKIIEALAQDPTCSTFLDKA